MDNRLAEAARIVGGAERLVAFTGAGMSVESGIPAFRGAGAIGSGYDPRVLEIEYFYKHPYESWLVIRDTFYESFRKARPNRGHEVLADLEREGRLWILVTQNIDDLHFRAGSVCVVEYHGNSRRLLCTSCSRRFDVTSVSLERLPPRCSCGSIVKPDFVFFGEPISHEARIGAERAAKEADCMLVIGTTGEVYPAAAVPRQAKRNGATIIEINPTPSAFTGEITDIHIEYPAAWALEELAALLPPKGLGAST